MNINMEIIISVALGITTLIGTFMAFYFKTKAKIEEVAVGAIDNVENTDKIGEQKLEEAVSQVYVIVPAILRPFVPKTIVKKIVQSLFNKIEAYAKKQCAKKK